MALSKPQIPGILVGYHGKLGAGKNEAEQQTRTLLNGSERCETKAFADNIKFLCARLCGTDLAAQYTQEGKNRSVLIFDALENQFLCNVWGIAQTMKEFHKFDNKTMNALYFDVCAMLLEAASEKDKQDALVEFTVGELQQELGTRFRQKYGEDIWVDLLFEAWTPSSNWFITDVRFPNEKAAIKARNGKCVKLVGDPKGVRARSTRNLNHISETALDHDTVWDAVIDNTEDNLPRLRGFLYQFIQQNKDYFATAGFTAVCA
jgi:hypothetical protein